ncbi:MAG: MerR family transcriptional regulator [Coriobacteriia bacterium]|nr:MerR family transcriptional regulator [Coriobacteriia bacterium]
MTKRAREARENMPLYMISVAAELAGVHPQTLRIYERRQLIAPQRSAGNTRLYSQTDIERLRLIQRLTQEEGINLAGVERILALEGEVNRLREEMDSMRVRLDEMKRLAVRDLERARREYKAEIVMIRRGGLARRD